MGRFSRRAFLGTAATAALASASRSEAAQAEEREWRSGDVRHLLPTVSHDRLLVKASIWRPLTRSPTLRVGSLRVEGRPTDTEGLHWLFDARDLESATDYDLDLREASGERLCDDWHIRTFPALLERPEHVRLLAFTCAGGHDIFVRSGERLFLPLETRRRLLRRGLSFAPDAVVANGDHVYWDQRTGNEAGGLGRMPQAVDFAGEFDRTLPVLGSPNEGVLKLAVGPQIADLYGGLVRSIPVFFLQDDHDYFEGDRVHDWIVSFPPDSFMLRAARATQWLYYPEFLPDVNRPSGLPGTSSGDRPSGVGESFGTLRYGRLLELLLYDCRRYMTLKGETGTFLPTEVETWIASRLADDRVRHLVQVPSVPIGWSAGKWGEWYPDVLDEDGSLGTSRPKAFWQRGWQHQHDRILEMSSRGARPVFILNGDLHSIAEATLTSSGARDFSSNPIHTAVVGPLGTNRGWPSAGRGTIGHLSTVLGGLEDLPCLEENGFTLVDIDPEGLTLRFFRWRPTDPLTGRGGEAAIDSLEPFRTVRWHGRA